MHNEISITVVTTYYFILVGSTKCIINYKQKISLRDGWNPFTSWCICTLAKFRKIFITHNDPVTHSPAYCTASNQTAIVLIMNTVDFVIFVLFLLFFFSLSFEGNMWRWHYILSLSKNNTLMKLSEHRIFYVVSIKSLKSLHEYS